VASLSAATALVAGVAVAFSVLPQPSAAPPPSAHAPELNLPRVPWAGGSAYWAQFSKARAAGWANPHFFPIALWWGGVTTDSDVRRDKALGINTYVLLNDSTPYSLLARNDMYFIGNALNRSFTSKSRNWVGDFLDDEIDGRVTPVGAAESQLTAERDAFGDDGRFKYANFTSQIVGGYMDDAAANAFANDFTDVVSIDSYYYTDGGCDTIWYQIENRRFPPADQAHCSSASSYGHTVRALRARDASDGKPQAVWNFIEDLSGAPSGTPEPKYIQPGQLEGAVMDSVIRGASGIIYFNQSMSGACETGNVTATGRDSAGCGAPQLKAMQHVDAVVRSLAPVLNTQSYRWTFGTGLDTMLKDRDGYAYIFAMTDGTGTPGSRTLALPPGIGGAVAQAVGENRSIAISGGKFSDTFDEEYTYHIYKVALSR